MQLSVGTKRIFITKQESEDKCVDIQIMGSFGIRNGLVIDMQVRILPKQKPYLIKKGEDLIFTKFASVSKVEFILPEFLPTRLQVGNKERSLNIIIGRMRDRKPWSLRTRGEGR